MSDDRKLFMLATEQAEQFFPGPHMVHTHQSNALGTFESLGLSHNGRPMIKRIAVDKEMIWLESVHLIDELLRIILHRFNMDAVMGHALVGESGDDMAIHVKITGHRFRDLLNDFFRATHVERSSMVDAYNKSHGSPIDSK